VRRLVINRPRSQRQAGAHHGESFTEGLEFRERRKQEGRPAAPFLHELEFSVSKNSQRLARVLLAELVDATAGVEDLLFARKERVAVRAHFDLEVVAECRTRNEGIPAAAGHRRVFIFRMDCGLHDNSCARSAAFEKGGAV